MKKALLIISSILLLLNVNAQSVYKIYAGQGYTSNIYVLDPITLDTLKFIPEVGGYRIAHCPMYNKVYSTGAGNNIFVLDAISDSLISIIDPSDGTNNTNELEPIVLSPDQSKLYVADESSDALFVLNTANDSIIAAVTLSNVDEMENMVISPDGLYLYVADNSDLLKINTQTLTVEASIEVNGDAHGVEISTDGQTVYSDASPGVLVVNTATFSVTDTILSVGYFLKLRTSGSHIVGVDESSYAHITELSSGITDTVTWSTGSAKGIISHPDNSEYFIATSQGIYKIDAVTLSVIDSSEQISFQSIIIIEDATTGISDPISDLNFVKVFPNPFHSSLTIQMNLNTSDRIFISIYDSFGRIVRSISPQYNLQGNKTITVDLSDVSSGIYFCRVIFNGKAQTIKAIKE